MKYELIKDELRRGAVRLDGCDEGMDQLLASHSMDDLVQIYLDRLDFCLEHDFPRLKDIRNWFKDVALAKGIYVDTHFDGNVGYDEHRTIVCLGDCSGELVFGGYAVCRVYLKHGCRVSVIALDHAIVYVDQLDGSAVNVISNGDAKVIMKNKDKL